jgi:acylphosphatase
MPCAKFIVSGRVQGVFFRASTRTEAVRLRLNGYAKNLADGSVEVLACGDATALDELQRWLHKGPPVARVESVERLAADEIAPHGFETS